MNVSAALSGNGKNLILTWTAVPNAIGYVFYRDGRRMSNTWDASLTQATMGIPDTAQHTYTVQAVSEEDSGTVKWPAPPAPTGTTGTTGTTGITGTTGPAGTPGMPNAAPPPFTPTRNVSVTTQSAFLSAVSNAQPGDMIVATGITFTGEITLTKVLSGIAEIHFVNCKATGAAAGSQLPAFWLNGLTNFRLYGCDVTGKGNTGFRIDGAKNVQWWDFNIHDCAGSGIYLNGGTGVTGLDLRGTLTNNGLDLSLDPHAEKGTGMHAFNLGGGNGVTTNCRFEITITSQKYGAGMQIYGLQNSTIYLDASNCTFVAQQQTGGNAIQFWGSDTVNLNIPYLKANVMGGPGTTAGHGGQAVNVGDGLDSSNHDIVVAYARATNCYGTPDYGTSPAVTYIDAQ